jgi:hypothetical protein
VTGFILTLIHRWNLRQFLYNWQTLIAGVLAVLAAWRTIRATTQSADREVAASQAQTAVAQKQIETTLRLERRRAASEGYAFCAMLEAAVGRVLVEAADAQHIFAAAVAQVPDSSVSRSALRARQRFTKSAFDELRSACVRYGGHLTAEFLELESEIDDFASSRHTMLIEGDEQWGLHKGLHDQLAVIEMKARHLREEAAAGMKGASDVLAETAA